MDRETSDTTRRDLIVFLALVALTLATLILSFLPLGPWHLAVGLAIGAGKAALVGLYFMQLAHSTARTRLGVAVGVFWLGIMIALTMTDYLTRPLASL